MVVGMQAEKRIGKFPYLFLEDICHIVIELLASGRHMHNKDRAFIIFCCIIQYTFYKGEIGYRNRVIVFKRICIQTDETDCTTSTIIL